MVLIGSALILYSYMSDWGAAFFQKYPKPYNWFMLAGGIILFSIAYLHLRKAALKAKEKF